MSGTNGSIGFSRRVRPEWMEYVAGLVMAGRALDDIRGSLHSYLGARLKGASGTQRGSYEKTASILLKVWVISPKSGASFRDDGLDLLRRLPRDQHLPIHWCMSMAVYPFWGATAEATGRLLRLQDSATAAQVQRRMRERYGERETVKCAVRHVLRSFCDWGVLTESGGRSRYTPNPPMKLRDHDLMAWMAEGTLRSSGNASSDFVGLLSSARLFPFDISTIRIADVERRDSIEVMRHAAGDRIALTEG